MSEETNNNDREYWESDDPNADVYVEEMGENAELACPGCFTQNPKENHFCEQCGKPLTGIASSDPFGQIFSEGYAYRSATERTSEKGSSIVLIGMWLIFGPSVLITGLGSIYTLYIGFFGVIEYNSQFDSHHAVYSTGIADNILLSILQATVLALLAMLLGTLLYKTTKAQTKN
ncbi:hypothetical protein KS4_07930 [Poriferisphaera corsica]|uniref:Zinc ribbon domain-containing protein n=1 Tax=Poriferisphaera corsica TaxID=2528020 RepID=A0A517YRA8_9BACT|nr:zinc ribbon domain-containing protein [Poriferisphaera corsica]QDU32759.1 hypothetical protein KS4_07930 [Poriferisphaera corsica]